MPKEPSQDINQTENEFSESSRSDFSSDDNRGDCLDDDNSLDLSFELSDRHAAFSKMEKYDVNSSDGYLSLSSLGSSTRRLIFTGHESAKAILGRVMGGSRSDLLSRDGDLGLSKLQDIHSFSKEDSSKKRTHLPADLRMNRRYICTDADSTGKETLLGLGKRSNRNLSSSSSSQRALGDLSMQKSNGGPTRLNLFTRQHSWRHVAKSDLAEDAVQDYEEGLFKGMSEELLAIVLAKELSSMD